jgi:nucleotide-binding universal stress UspA family protein
MVPEIKKILFTTDLSQNARHAFRYAVALAYRHGAELVVLHVMEDHAPYADGYLQNFLGEERWKQIKEQREAEARQILIGKQQEGALIRQALDEFCAAVRSELGDIELPAEELVVAKGNTVNEILSAVEDKSCDLIVMGYSARGKLGEAFLGSTSRRVLRLSRVPVLLVRLPEE